MSSRQRTTGEIELHVRHVGGIDETEVTFSPGVTILEGRNATNRTSLLQAIMAVCGSENVSIKGDSDEAGVELAIGGEVYTRTLTRTGGSIRTGGDPYLDDSTLADLFAFLLGSNEARREVLRGGDLRELIMRPVDTEEIQDRIERLIERRRTIDDELEEIDRLKRRIPELEEERTGIADEIESKRAELAEKETEIESFDGELEQTKETNSEFEQKLSELGDKRSALEETRYTLETENDRLAALEREHRELLEEREQTDEVPDGEREELDEKIDALRREKQALEAEVNELQTVIGFNEEMLDTDELESLPDLHDGQESGGAVTDRLLEDAELTCWTCGSTVDREQIETTVKKLRELSRQKYDDVSDIDDRLEECISERDRLESIQRRHSRIEERIAELTTEIESQENTIADLETRRETLREEIEELEAEIERREDESRSEILERHKEANQLEYDIGRLETDLERVDDELASIESELERRDDLEDEREQIRADLEDLRTRIERLEKEAITEFNEHMETILDLLDYENLEKIWIERILSERQRGRNPVDEGDFELHVIRSTDSGATYEDTIDHLSESEREVIGLVFALAGYLVHDVHEQVPFMLLDSLEAIDSDRIVSLVEYFSDFSRYLVVALLPEDAASMKPEYAHITDI